MNKNKQSLKSKIVFRFSGLVALSMLSIILFVIYFIDSNMSKQADILLKNRVDFLQHKVENHLNNLVDSVDLLAKHDLMLNSLIDKEGRDKYLMPLMKNFMQNKNVIAMHVVDYDGKAIFKTKKNTPGYSDSKYLRRSLAMGETTYYINKNNLVIISPIKYYKTTQGSLIAEFDFNKIADNYSPKKNSSYLKIFKDKSLVYKSNFQNDKKYYSYVASSSDDNTLNRLGLILEMGLLESDYLEPIKSTRSKLLFIGLLVLIIGILLAYLLAVSITNPILKLYTKVKAKQEIDDYEPLGTNDELDTLSEAFYERAKELKHSQEKYLSLYDNSPDMHFSVDAKTANIVTCNKTFMEKLGYTKEKIIGKNIFELYHPDYLDLAHQLFDSLESGQGLSNIETQLVKKNKESIYVLLNVSSLRDNNGNINSTFIDITQKKEHEEQMRENERLLFQQSKMASMGEMIGNIAHQWRQPLSSMTISSANLRASVELEEKLTNEDIVGYSKNIEEQCTYLSKTIDDFRNFFTPNKEKSEFSIKDSIDKTMRLMSASFKTNGIEVIENIEDIRIVSLENELTQAMLNILKNAKDAVMLFEDERRLIFINAYKKDSYAYVDIKDNGGGVPKDIIDKIFEPYFTTKHKSQGTGIGLYMTETIITKHIHGEIHADNVEYEYQGKNYKGARFTIEIPLENEKLSDK